MTTLPDTPAGRRAAWYLDRLASAGADATEADLECFEPGLVNRRWAPGVSRDIAADWRSLGEQVGAFELASVEEASPCTLAVIVNAANGKRWRASFRVEEQGPHRIEGVDWERVFDFDVTVREAMEADAAALSEVERRCPIVLGDTSVTFDRGDAYFAFARLMEEVTVAAGFVGGVAAAINCGALHTMRIGGVDMRVMTAIHTRVLPEHQGKGLWGAVGRVFNQKYAPGAMAGSHGYVSVENVAMQHGFRRTPNKWAMRALRAQLRSDRHAGPRAGRPATPGDAARIIDILNATHEDEELYLPYTVESLTQRLTRAPEQYSWERVWLTDNAVAGVWPAGDTIRVITESPAGRTESRRGLVLDYGFLPGAEDELEALLRAWCGWLAARDLDTLSIFTSERSPGYERIRGLADAVDAFDMWTPGIPEPAGAPERGLYTDQVYF